MEWVDINAGARGAATIVNGLLAAHKVDALDTAGRSARPVYVAVSGTGRLELALTFFRANRDEWLGYALSADRDALLRVVRTPESDAVELFATEGGAEWCLRWRTGITQPDPGFEAMATPQPIDQAVYRELEQVAQAFVAEWIWFVAGPEGEIAIEKDRYARYGYVICDANVKSARLHAMRQDSSAPEGWLEFSALDANEIWVRDVVERTWCVSHKKP